MTVAAIPRGLLVVLSGPSGAGKGTVRRGLEDRVPLRFGVAATTRDPRPGEVDGRDYYFLTTTEFRRRIRSGEFIEWAEVFGNLYGTPREPMTSWLEDGLDVVVEKDIQGARTLRRACPFATLVFIMPPSRDDLESRVRGRGTEDGVQLDRRLKRADEEMSAAAEYDYVVVNDSVDESIDALVSILRAEKHRTERFLAAENGGSMGRDCG